MKSGLRFSVRLASLVAAYLALGGCALPYYWQAIRGETQLLRKRTPIAEVLKDPEVPRGTRAALANVARIKAFAAEQLDLPARGSYSTYVDVGRPYVVWNVIATPEFSIEPKRWCFPVVGCVSYRGYFHKSRALRFQRSLVRKGYDTFVGGSTAFSTLGHFDDPVLSTVLNGGERELASVLFHELAHQRLYVKNDSAFSEAFATCIEEYGMQLWLQSHGDAHALAKYRRALRHRREFAQLVAEQRQRLRRVFAQPIDAEHMRAAKADAYARMRADYRRLKASWDGATDYDGWFAGPLNNAALAAVATYQRWLPALNAQLAQLGLARFYAEMERLAELDTATRGEILDGWTSTVVLFMKWGDAGRREPAIASESG